MPEIRTCCGVSVERRKEILTTWDGKRLYKIVSKVASTTSTSQ
jgi:hypothetical protein